MSITKATGVRIPEEILEKVDEFAGKLCEERPGASVTRADAVRVLILRGLSVEVPRPGDVPGVPAPRAGRRGRR